MDWNENNLSLNNFAKNLRMKEHVAPNPNPKWGSNLCTAEKEILVICGNDSDQMSQ